MNPGSAATHAGETAGTRFLSLAPVCSISLNRRNGCAVSLPYLQRGRSRLSSRARCGKVSTVCLDVQSSDVRDVSRMLQTELERLRPGLVAFARVVVYDFLSNC